MKQIKFVDQHDYGCEVPACSRKDLILSAHEIHRALGYKGEGAFPILKLAEHVFFRVYENYAFEVVSEEEMGDDLGKTYPDEHVIKIREDVYDAAAQGQGFARMVIAHECAHLLKHEGVPVAMACRKASKELPAYKSSEWQANALAGSLLMPASKIINLSIQEIVETYGVSFSAACAQKKAIRKEAGKWLIPQL